MSLSQLDLSWQQIQDASGKNLITPINNKLHLNLYELGVTGSLLGTEGVVQAMYTLREICAKAQSTANVNKNIGQRLAAFPMSSSGTPINGYATNAGQIITRIPLSLVGILGNVN